MKKENEPKRCKNGHPIERRRLILLGHTVGVCLHCGHKYILSAVPATYTWSERNKLGEQFHVYTFASLLACEHCHGFMTSIQISCKTHEEQEEIWRKELDENLHSTPDNRSDVPASS